MVEEFLLMAELTGNNLFRDNSAYKGSGGGIMVCNNSNLNLTGINMPLWASQLGKMDVIH